MPSDLAIPATSLALSCFAAKWRHSSCMSSGLRPPVAISLFRLPSSSGEIPSCWMTAAIDCLLIVLAKPCVPRIADEAPEKDEVPEREGAPERVEGPASVGCWEESLLSELVHGGRPEVAAFGSAGSTHPRRIVLVTAPSGCSPSMLKFCSFPGLSRPPEARPPLES